MGYSRYWRPTKKVQNGFGTRFVGDIRRMLCVAESHGISVCGWDGRCAAEITRDVIAFNGDASVGEDHESFVLATDRAERGDFCKTNRKPYDAFVYAVLFYAGYLGYVTEISDNGENGTVEALRILVDTVGLDRAYKISVESGVVGPALDRIKAAWEQGLEC